MHIGQRLGVVRALLCCVAAGLTWWSIATCAAQDPSTSERARELLETMRTRIYAPRTAGLRDARVVMAAPFVSATGGQLVLYWRRGEPTDQVVARVEGVAGVQPASMVQLAIQVEQAFGQLLSGALPLWDAHATRVGDLQLELLAERTRITRKAADPEQQLAIELDGQALPLAVIGRYGGEPLRLALRWQLQEDRHLLAGYSMALPQLGGDNVFEVVWQRLGAYWLPQQATVRMDLGSKDEAVSYVFRFEDYRVDAGIADEVFAPR